jgi:hypothetical protein
MTRIRTAHCLVWIALSSLLISTMAAAETKKAAPRTLPLKAGGLLSLENIDGDVTIEGWKREEVLINATKTGAAKSLDRIKILVESTEDRVQISTEYVESHLEYLHEEGEYLESRLRELESFSSQGSIEYTIKAPLNAIRDGIEHVNGSLTIKGMTGRVSLSTVNGSITANDLADSAEIETVNGDILLSFDQMKDGQTVDLSTVNGAITVQIPPKANADVYAETLNGEITTEFELAMERGQWIGSSMEGRLGAGGAYIALETVNGSIAIKKR